MTDVPGCVQSSQWRFTQVDPSDLKPGDRFIDIGPPIEGDVFTQVIDIGDGTAVAFENGPDPMDKGWTRIRPERVFLRLDPIDSDEAA